MINKLNKILNGVIAFWTGVIFTPFASIYIFFEAIFDLHLIKRIKNKIKN